MSVNETCKSDESFDGAVQALYSALHQSKTKEALAKAAARRKSTIQDMREYMKRIGLQQQIDDNPRQSVIHITGTKGKGSTSCICESILRQHYGVRTGLFTSPHLLDIRERIRINGKPVSKDVFAKVYWEIRKRLESKDYDHNDDDQLPKLPGYFRMLTLMALYTFHFYQPPLDVIILEVGMGGRYDATNLLDMDKHRAVVCGVTLLDLDHTSVLGDTLEKIAWEKGGIFQTQKGYVPSEPKVIKESHPRFFTIASNTNEPLQVLRNCAANEGQGNLIVVDETYPSMPNNFVLGLQGQHQRINAALAVALCEAIMRTVTHSPNTDPESLRRALANASWPGRCQTVRKELENGSILNFRLDGAHTTKSVEAGFHWFSSESRTVTIGDSNTNIQRILIFNCSHERNPIELLKILTQPEKEMSIANGDDVQKEMFKYVYFCRADFSRPSQMTAKSARELLNEEGIIPQSSLLPPSSSPTWQETLESIWKHLTPVQQSLQISSSFNAKEAIEMIDCIAKQSSRRLDIFVVGSLYIVGSILDKLRWSEVAAQGSVVDPGTN